MNKRVLVIGGTGLLGSPVTRQLQEDGFQVRIMARDLEKARAQFGEDYELVAGDITDLAQELAAAPPAAVGGEA